MPSHPFLDETLRIVPRRYRLPVLCAGSEPRHKADPATTLAIVIERARLAIDHAETPDPALKGRFTEALTQMIQEAMRVEAGDPAFQAIVLRHRVAQVREYASLAAHGDQDRRLIHATANAIAHPAKQRRMPPGRQRDALVRLHSAASAGSWAALSEAAHGLLAMPELANEPLVQRGLSRLLDDPALGRLQRLDALASHELVRQYLSLLDRHGPRQGSATAAEQGAASQQRGADVEALATQALEALAQRLNEEEEAQSVYRVVTSMRVPPSIPASPDRAKSEWDAVLLRQSKTTDATTAWDVCLLVEAKASADAATTDLPRLLRGIRLLAHAQESVSYPFETRQGVVWLRGASLKALTTDEAQLAKEVLYCCEGPVEAAPRLLGAASRMQLLSARASLEFASALVDGRHADTHGLERVWHQLLESPRWNPVLCQYPTLRLARELMVHTDDLLDTVRRPIGSV
jgi:hypothetical protein